MELLVFNQHVINKTSYHCLSDVFRFVSSYFYKAHPLATHFAIINDSSVTCALSLAFFTRSQMLSLTLIV